ncbi:MAG: hypothetical protein QM534_11100 [Sediminibacterium sp.]|nr:hypothetical protein [Sediminibacterium sp.]
METSATKTGTGIPDQKPRWKKYMLWALGIFSVIWLIYYFICGLTYSEGKRSGVLIKVSRKGYIFKTYEGELNSGGISQGDGTIMPNAMFKFSVSEESVFKKLEDLQGKKVVVDYKQVMKNFFWQGETDYFIQEVKEVK